MSRHEWTEFGRTLYVDGAFEWNTTRSEQAREILRLANRLAETTSNVAVAVSESGRLASEVDTLKSERTALKEERDEAMAMLEERIYLALKGGGNSLHLGRFNRLRARISGRELEATLLSAREQPAGTKTSPLSTDERSRDLNDLNDVAAVLGVPAPLADAEGNG